MVISMANNNFPREVLDSLDSQRFQENTARAFNQQSNSGIISGAMSGAVTKVADGIYKVEHMLNREAVGFMIVSQTDATSYFAEITNSPTPDVPVEKNKVIYLKFSNYADVKEGIPALADPGTIRVFLY